jgi:hypothetical protein
MGTRNRFPRTGEKPQCRRTDDRASEGHYGGVEVLDGEGNEQKRRAPGECQHR